MTGDFIAYSGKNVKNIYFSTNFDINSKDEDYLKFLEIYKAKFDKEPSYASIYGYESVMVSNEGIKKVGTNIKRLKKAIIDISKYDGLQGDFIIDKFGDVKREIYKIKVEDSRYKNLDEK